MNQTRGNADSGHELTEREREILRLVVRSFIETAGPIGSRFLARRFPLGLSPASIRNTMSDLEELGYLDHPYTSAGRVPTELGYRKFVNELMEAPGLSPAEKQLLRAELESLMAATDDLFRDGSRLLGRLSNLLGIVLTPRLATAVLDHLDVVPLSSTRAMFVLSMRGGLVKTIVLEIDSDMSRESFDRVLPLLNEKLSGLTLEEIRKTYEPRIRSLEDSESGVVRLVLNEAPVLFGEQADGGRVRFAGAQNILAQPEFQELSDVRNLMEIIENEDSVVDLLESGAGRGDSFEGKAMITIGRENPGKAAEKYSIVTARYRMGESVGTVGVVGPMRMDYSRVVALVEGMAHLLGEGTEEQDS